MSRQRGASPPGQVRISSGRLRGRVLAVPAGVRPTPQLARQALGNILAPALAGTRFLELFCGTGAVGLEAFSRGCPRVVLVEGQPAVAARLRRSIDELGLTAEPGLTLLALPVARALPLLAGGAERFDYVFIDPPYDLWRSDATGGARAGVAPLAEQLGSLPALLAPGARVIIQRDREQQAASQAVLDTLGLSPEPEAARRYSRTCLDFFRARDST